MQDACFIYTNTNTQGRLGTHTFDLVLPPLGITYLSAVLEGEGYSVTIVDANAEQLTDQQLLARLENKFSFVGFYCHTQNYGKILQLAAALKAGDNPPFIAIGGPHATAMPEESLRDGQPLDAVAFGEAEETIVELLPKALANESLRGIRGVVFRENGEVIKNEPRAYIEDLDSLPMPAWHLLPMHKYRNFIEAGGKPVLQVMGSRGCPIDCNYCFSTKMWSPKVRWHSSDRVLAEIDHLRANFGIRFIQFLDDNFTLDRSRVGYLTGEFRKRKLAWCCSTRIDLLDDKVLGHLKKGRVDHVSIGIESVNDRLLGVIGKKITKSQVTRTIELCAKHGVNVLGMFILGIPTETDQEAKETVEFAVKHRFWFAVFSHMTFYPGTNFWEQYKHAHWLNRDFSDYCLSKNFSALEPTRDRASLEAIMKNAYLRFYSKPRVFFSLVFLMLKNPRQLLEICISFAGIGLRLLTGKREKPPAVAATG